MLESFWLDLSSGDKAVVIIASVIVLAALTFAVKHWLRVRKLRKGVAERNA